MRWLLARFASLLGHILAALSGAAASQTLAFIYAYQQRLGGHLDEAQRTLDGLRDGTMASAAADPAARQQLMEEFARRVADLRTAYDAIANAGVFAKPAAFAAHADYAVASATLNAFTPAVPVDLPSLVFALAGLAVGWAVWQAGEAAVGRLARRRRLRRADRLPSGRRSG
jgi:hypothetical protein